MNQLPALTKQQHKTLLDFHNASTPGETNYLNPADPVHKAIITAMLSIAGHTEEKYPHLYNSIANAKGAPKTPKGKNAKEKVHLVDAGKTAAGKATVTIWARSTSNNITKGGNLMVFDSKSGQLLAQGENTAVRSGFVSCPTRTATAGQAGKKLSVLYMGHVTEENGTTRFFSYANTMAVAQTGILATLTAPVISHPGNTDIQIAVGRNAGVPPPSNTDYVYVETGPNEQNPYLIAPFTGNVPLSGTIDLASLTASDLSTSIFVDNGNGGTAEITRATAYTTDADLVAAFQVGSTPNILQWNFPYDSLSYQNTKSIVYNPAVMTSEIDSYFYFAFNSIPLQGGTSSPPFYVCSVDTPGEDKSINCTVIPNMYYWWHCLAKGTRVTLEDGTEAPIEKINEKYRVKTGTKDKSLAVWATVLGHHSSDPEKGDRAEIFRLTTANGKKITATENHMVFMTPAKCRMISHLKVGDSIMTDEGASVVKTIKAVAGNGMFYGLALGNAKEKAQKNFPHNLANYYAGGILCGDQQSMRFHAMEANHDPEYMLPRIKPALQQDYLSALEGMRVPATNAKPTNFMATSSQPTRLPETKAMAKSANALAASSVIQNLYYVSPYSTLPPGFTTSGIILQTVTAQSPTPSTVQAPILVIRLRQASSGAVIGTSATSGPGTGVKTATYQPAFPLSAAEPYMIDIIWVSSGTSPENIDWNSAIASAPVSAAEVSVASASYDGTNVNAVLSYGSAGIGTGAQVNVFSLSGGVLVNVGTAQTQNNIVSIPVNASGYPPAFYISAQCAIPVTNTGSGSFAGPFSLGPQSPITNASGTAQYGGVPQAASALTTASYDGAVLTLSWSLATQVGCVAPDSSLIQVLSGTQVIGLFKGGTTSANIPLNVLGQSGISVKVSSVAGTISSVPISFNLITQAPVVTTVAANLTNNTVTASFTTSPASQNVSAVLLEGSKQLATSSGTAGALSLAYNATGLVGLNVAARTVSTDGTITGPACLPVTLLATTPSLVSAKIYTNPANTAQWKIDLTWSRLPDAADAVTSYTASAFDGTTALGTPQTVSGTSASITFNKSAISTATQTIQLCATSASGGLSPVQTLYALFSAPVLTSLVTGTDQITATWTVPAIPGANTQPVTYQPVVSAGGTTIYTGMSTASTEGAVPLSEIAVPAVGTILVMANVSLGPVTLLADATMGTGTNASPLLSGPAIGLVTVAATSNISTLNWAAVTNATAYNIYFTDGTSQTAIAATTYPLTTALAPGQMKGYSIRATGTSNGVALTGPSSLLAYVPTNPGNVAGVRFDGTNVVASWSSVAGALCYNVLIYDNSVPAVQLYSGSTNETVLAFTVANVSSAKLYTVYVQPVMAGGTGLSGTTAALFGPGFFLSQQPATTALPYVYAANTMAALGSSSASPTAQAIILYLPELGAAAGALGTVPIVVDPFTIEPSGDTALPYKLTIAADDLAWAFGTTAIRATLQQNYVDFLKALEAPPAGSLPGAVPYGISLVQAAIACSLPQTFAELLYYNFGLSTSSTVGAGYIDLRPGMILRISTGDYVNIGQTSPPTWINGYAGASVLDFEIGSYTSGANWRTGFDSFLNVLSAAGALKVNSPAASTQSVQAGLAGSVDLYYPQFVQPFYRLYFPAAISSPWGTGSNTTTSNFTLTAASSYTTLQNTTVDPTVTPTAYFRGRTTVEVMIKVMVNGNERLVAAGTSIGNLLEQLNLRPSANSPVFKTLRVYRSIVASITNLQTSSAAGPLMEMRLDWNGMQVYSTGNGLNSLSIPLMQGDQVYTG
ncbi:MAG: hypothetical protein JWP12_2880 [Bacteroidetes bacterium]|nr:hypothetical protein [Bacteroidota bacterium]